MPSAAILTGGQASRFGGRDKSGLLVDGRSILERQIDELAHMTDDILIVGVAQDVSCSSCLRGEAVIRHIPDRAKDCGPLGGLDAALAAAREDLVVVIACDMPFVTAAFLNYLASLTNPENSVNPVNPVNIDAVVPRISGRDHPLCAVYARTCRPAIDARLAAGRLSMIGLLESLRVRVVGEHEIEPFGRPDTLLSNVNTPAEFDALAAFSGHES